MSLMIGKIKIKLDNNEFINMKFIYKVYYNG